MTMTWERVDTWLASAPFSARDLGIYRIIYGIHGLLTLRQISWLAEVPDVFFAPPPGPFELASEFPSIWVLTTMDILLAVLMASLTIGFLTRFSSIGVCVLLIMGDGFVFSTGKIDHTILIAVVPGVMAFSGWGHAASADALLHPHLADRAVRGWLVRVLGFCVGASMLTAGLPKLYNGWMRTDSQASLGYQAIEYYANQRQSGLAEFFVHLNAPWYWETLDWLTVIIECSIILAAFSWRLLRVAVAALTIFHLGVLLSLNIAFSQNIIVYAAFFSWALIIHPRKASSSTTRFFTGRSIIFVLIAITAGFVVWWITMSVGPGRMAWLGPTIVVVGAVFGVGFLLTLSWKLFRRVVAKQIA